jgi:hypothetical protein
MVWDTITVIGSYDVVFRERAIPWRCGSEYCVRTEIIRPCTAIFAAVSLVRESDYQRKRWHYTVDMAHPVL